MLGAVVAACLVENFAGGSIQSESVGSIFWICLGALLRMRVTGSTERLGSHVGSPAG